MRPSPWQGTQAAHCAAVAHEGGVAPGMDAAARWRYGRQSAVPEPERDGNDTLERYAAACTVPPDCRCRSTAPARPQHLTAHDPAYHRNAPAPVGGGHHRDRVVARPREPDDDAPVHRGRPGNE